MLSAILPEDPTALPIHDSVDPVPSASQVSGQHTLAAQSHAKIPQILSVSNMP